METWFHYKISFSFCQDHPFYDTPIRSLPSLAPTNENLKNNLEDKYKKSHTGHPIYKVSFQKEVTQMLLTILIVCAVLLALLCVYALLRSAAQADAITQQIQETLVKK